MDRSFVDPSLGCSLATDSCMRQHSDRRLVVEALAHIVVDLDHVAFGPDSHLEDRLGKVVVPAEKQSV